jgi:hypothetical protein
VKGAAPDRDVVTWLGLAVVGAAAAVLSFSALSDLARICGITATLEVNGWTLRAAWLLPVTIDVLAAVATRIWLRNRAAREAVTFARRAAWGAIAATVGGNAYHGYLVRSNVEPPMIVWMLVGAVPAVVLGGLVHLAVLVGRPAGDTGGQQSAAPGRLVRWRAAAGAWWEMRKAERKAAESGRADAGETGRKTGGPPVPTGADSNDVLAADLRRLNAARQAKGEKPLGRDAVIARYKPIGSTRAQTVIDMSARPEPPARPHVVRDGEAAS